MATSPGGAGGTPLPRAAEPALARIRAETDFVPEVGLILGSGLGALADRVEPVRRFDYADLPGFPCPMAPGHPGRLVLGELEGRRVCVFQGRAHYYEGHPMRDVAAGVRLVHGLGAGTLLVTNAAGIANRGFAPGSLMAIADHINLMGTNPLIGRSPEEIVDMFPDMSRPYDPDLRRALHEAAREDGIALLDGVYVAVTGPSYETPAEVEFLRRAGADAIGMSTVPEVIAARERGLRVAGISCLTNYAAGLTDAPLTHDEVLAAAAAAGMRLETLVRGFLRRLPNPDA